MNKRIFIRIMIFAFAIIINYTLKAQEACSFSGYNIGQTTEFGSASYANGDIIISSNATNPSDINSADWLLSPSAQIDVFASITIPTGSVVRLKSGSVLNVYGNLNNYGYLFIEHGATINFYGKIWKNSINSILSDGLISNNLQENGKINFIAPRPLISSNENASTCIMNNYSGGNFSQQIDGGNIPMHVSLHILNNNNISLINTDTKLDGLLYFDIIEGDLITNNQNIHFTKSGGYIWQIANAKDAYIVTNSDSKCGGYVEFEKLAPSSNFVFPIGRSEMEDGHRNFTPVIVQNDSSIEDDIKVQVKNYNNVSNYGVMINQAPLIGQNHVWQIISKNGGKITANFQQSDNITLGINFSTLFDSRPASNVYQYISKGNLFLTGGPRTIGSGASPPPGVAQQVDNSFEIPSTNKNCANDSLQWFIKVIEDANFTKGLINLTKANQNYSNVYIKKDTSASKIVNFDFDQNSISIFPNPTKGFVKINNLNVGDQIQLYGIYGQLLISKNAISSREILNLSNYDRGIYTFVIKKGSNKLITKKIINIP